MALFGRSDDVDAVAARPWHICLLSRQKKNKYGFFQVVKLKIGSKILLLVYSSLPTGRPLH